MQFLIILAILSLAVMFVTSPLRRAPEPGPARGADEDTTGAAVRLEELEAAREAKYREIRDADLDHRTGKLSDGDYAQLDQTLRTEAIEILRGIDQVQPSKPAA
jgi:hypothetical protein